MIEPLKQNKAPERLVCDTLILLGAESFTGAKLGHQEPHSKVKPTFPLQQLLAVNTPQQLS